MKNLIFALSIYLSVLFVSAPGQAMAESTIEASSLTQFLPQHLKLQTGGYLGMVAVGAGYSFFTDTWRNDVLYGFVPKSYAGVDVHTFMYKTDVATPHYALMGAAEWVPAYFGAGLMYTPSKETHALLPDRYPESYYPSTAIFFELHLGTEFLFSSSENNRGVRKHGLIAELNMHELAVLAWLGNFKYFSISDLLTYTVGYKAIF